MLGRNSSKKLPTYWRPASYIIRIDFGISDGKRGICIQVLHVNNNHSITVSNIQCTSGNVNVFDCNLGMDISHRTKQLCSSVRFQDKKITVRIKPIQRQQNGPSDCGVCALAFVTSIPFAAKYVLLRLRITSH